LLDSQFFKTLISTPVRFVRRQRFQNMPAHLVNLAILRQPGQAVSALSGCAFLATVFERFLTALQIPALSGCMDRNIFILAQNAFLNEPTTLFTLTQAF